MIITLLFEPERETPGTWRYKEQPAEGTEPVIGTMYLKKHLLKAAGFTAPPGAIVVTVNLAPESTP